MYLCAAFCPRLTRDEVSLHHTERPFPPAANALLTDLYELSMASAYWKTGKADEEAAFYLSFRKAPFQGGFTLCCGLADSTEYLLGFKFTASDRDYLAGLKGNDGKRLFELSFLKYLGKLKLRLEWMRYPKLHSGIKRFENPHQYPAGLELTLHEFKTELILRARGKI